MPSPSELTIATKAVQRLVKEETFYRAELTKQEARVQGLQAEVERGGPDLDVNAEYVLKQEVWIPLSPSQCTKEEGRGIGKRRNTGLLGGAGLANTQYQTQAAAETKAVFGPLRKRTAEAVAKLEEQIALSDSAGSADAEELNKAREALKLGQEAVEKENE